MRKFITGLKIFFVVALFVSGLISFAQAGLITPGSAAGTGEFYNGYTFNSSGGNAGILIDGYMPPEQTWRRPLTPAELQNRYYRFNFQNYGTTVWWNYEAPIFTIDLFRQYMVQDVVIQVDNNDKYIVEYSPDSINWHSLFTILPSYGDILEYPGGMDTMSTIAGTAQYVSAIDFDTPVSAGYLRIYGRDGDNAFGVSEVQVYGYAVPEPSTFLLLVAGLAGIAIFRKRLAKVKT